MKLGTDRQVPEAYFDQVVFYLKTLPGLARKVSPSLAGSREDWRLIGKGMIETAKKHAKASVDEAQPDESERAAVEDALAEDGAETTEAEKEAKKVDEAEEGESDDPAVVEMRRERAQRILKALGAR